MATYKVIQDIEAEDKLIGPFTLRQFIYAGIVIACGFIAFQVGRVQWWLALPFLLPMFFFGLLAAPIGKDQSSEVWLLAKIRFYLKPRKRIWDQTGVKDLVTITVPKTIERHLTDGLNQVEVRSRLRALADVIDSRGWSTKNASINMFTPRPYGMQTTASVLGSDRLVAANDLATEVPSYDVVAADDILDERNNPRAQQLSQMVDASAAARRQQAVAIASGTALPSSPYPIAAPQQPAASAPPADYWFLNGLGTQAPAPPTGYASFGGAPLISSAAPSQTYAPAPMPAPIAPITTATVTAADEAALLAHLEEERSRSVPAQSHMKTILPVEDQRRQAAEAARLQAEIESAQLEEMEAAAMTQQSNTAILALAHNDDLNVATIARQANKQAQQSQTNGEVVVSLH